MSASPPEVRVVADLGALHALAAEVVVQRMQAAIARAGYGTLALAGGKTPEGLYRRLAQPDWRAKLDWGRIHIFWSDERHVAPDDPASNYRMAREALLDAVPVPGTHVHRVRAEEPDAARAAEEYERDVRDVLGAGAGSTPRFDVVLLGIGGDGHCASLFPETAGLEERERLVIANWVPKLAAWRLTFTYPLIDAARTVVFLAEGGAKASAVAQALRHPSPVPAGRVSPTDGELIWLLDPAAASAQHP